MAERTTVGPSSGNAQVSALERAAAIGFILFIAASVFVLQMVSVHLKQTKKRNRAARSKLFAKLGLEALASDGSRRRVIAFFHPYCNAGGGGERVMWQAIEYHLRSDDSAVIVVFSGDVDESNTLDIDKAQEAKYTQTKLTDGAKPASKAEILSKCFERFAIPLHATNYASRIHFLPLENRLLVSDKYWKRLTLLGQSYGAMRLAAESCGQVLPDVWIDTMGYGFAYPIVKAFDRRIRVGAYVHYPMISTDMLQRVKERQVGHTNDANVSTSAWRSRAKLIYYQLFAKAYAYALRRADVLVANGSWTQNHVNTLIGAGRPGSRKAATRYAEVVYPPCDTGSMSDFPLEGRDSFSLISLAQFRPEKEHSTQIRIISEVVKARQTAGKDYSKIHLTCAGSCRNSDDEARIEALKSLARELGVEQHVSFVVNAPYKDILVHLRKASIGLSTMVDEHFGINVVEFMASGLITLSHASAGPLLDIAVPVDNQPTGFHAKTVADFASELERIFALEDSAAFAIRQRARQRAIDTFSNKAFCTSWADHLWRPLVDSDAEQKKRQ